MDTPSSGTPSLRVTDSMKLILLAVLTLGALSTKFVRIGPVNDPLVDPAIDPDNLQGLRFVCGVCRDPLPARKSYQCKLAM